MKLFWKHFNKKMKRTRYERLENIQSQSSTSQQRPLDSTPQRTQESKETSTTEPQERENQVTKGIILDCTCGSWSHPCEEVWHEKHDCPDNCIRSYEHNVFSPEKHLIITTSHDGEHDAN